MTMSWSSAQEANMAYPLISKSKGYKKFRTSLSSFLQKLLVASADDLLYDTSFYEHFQAWIHALSSSQIRALRHTATVVALQLVHALSVLRIQVDKEHAQTVRAKEAEEKKGRKDKARLRDMERQVKEAHKRLQAVEEYMEESYNSLVGALLSPIGGRTVALTTLRMCRAACLSTGTVTRTPSSAPSASLRSATG